MYRREGFLRRAVDWQLYYQYWHPAQEVQAALLIVHGFGEHSGRYEHVAQHLAPKGYAVYAFDLRGHGRSPGQRGHIDRWGDFREDVLAFTNWVRGKNNQGPFFLMGHSLGGLIVLEYVLNNPEGLSGVVASGPVLSQPAVSPFLLLASRVLSSLWPTFTMGVKLDTAALSRDPEVVRAYRSDSLVHAVASARLGAEIQGAIRWTNERAPALEVPLLLLHGGADRLASPEASRAFFDKVALPDKEYCLLEGFFHEPHNDVEWRKPLGTLERWLRGHGGP